MKKIVVATLAHVDAGKTTLSESMLYLSQTIRNFGRVDHRDSFLDFEEQERARGITIYAKESRISIGDDTLVFIDTPGHVDFGNEMQRCLPALDYAILIISGIDGIQAHSETIYRLLKEEHIPLFVFVNKMDIAYRSKEEIMDELKTKLDSSCVDFTQDDFYEDCATSSESLLEQYLETGMIEDEAMAMAIANKELIPVFFGSALKHEGVNELMQALIRYSLQRYYPQDFGAFVYKISHDDKGQKLTHLKVSGGVLQAKMKVNEQEKIDQVRQYHGSKYEVVNEVVAGDTCVVSGLDSFKVGDGLGNDCGYHILSASPLMNYHMVLPKNVDPFLMMRKLKPLMLEDPQLEITYHPRKEEIRISIMGEVQMEILKQKILKLCGVEVEFDEGMIAYKETIRESVEGVGHYEPLRHYSEVHIRIDPLPLGSGIEYASEVSQDVLERHWQRLILNHMKEKNHVGVLAGFPLTDVRLTLVSGKAHLKHTEGGDFREATYRAIRQGLMKANSVLLEPYYHFKIEVAHDYFSKVFFDLEQMEAVIAKSEASGEVMVIEGKASVAALASYPLRLRTITKGSGKISCDEVTYHEANHMQEVVDSFKYDAVSDLENPCGSVFCEHGSAKYVEWNKVEEYMHLPMQNSERSQNKLAHNPVKIDDDELKRVMARIYGPKKEVKKYKKPKVQEEYHGKGVEIKPVCMLVDAYNVIHDFNLIEDGDIASARDRLIDILCSYQGLRGCEMIAVFDAYKVERNTTTKQKVNNLHVIYTKKSQTADSYIEQATHHLSKDYQVIVVTSDALEQLIVVSQGAIRLSAREFKLEIDQRYQKEKEQLSANQPVFRNMALEKLREIKFDDDEK